MSLRGMTMVAALVALLAGSPAALAQGVDELIARTPAPTAREQQEVSRRLMALGAPGVKVLCQRIRNPLEAGDAKARLALHHVATYVARPGAPEAERKAFAAGAGEALRLVELNVHAKAFIVQQLQLAGGPDAVPALAGLLADEGLCEPAAQALVAIGISGGASGGEPARAALRSAFPASAGARRVSVVKALAELKDDKLVEPVAAEVESRDLALRRVAAYYLANSGQPAAANPVEKAALAEDRYERSRATMLYLLLAKRLTENGHADTAARICRELYQNRPEETQVRCAALAQLAATAGESAAEELFAALDEEAIDVRAAARALLVKLPGDVVTRRWVERIASKELPPERRAEAVLALGERGDRSGATPALATAAKDADAAVRSAAITALGTLGGGAAIGELLAVLEKGAAEADRKGARDALTRARGDEVEATIAARYPAAPPALKAQLLRVLAARNAEGVADRAALEVESPAEEVRIAAYEALAVHGGGEVLPTLVLKLTTAGDNERAAAERALGAIAARSPDRQGAAQVILASMAGAQPAVRAALLRTLGKVGGEQALAAVREATEDADPAIREAAVRSLAEWPTAAGSADVLLAVARARAEDDEKVHALAVRGALRQAERLRNDPAAAAALLAKVLDVARRPEERKQALAQLGGVEHVEALKLAASLAADPALGAEASVAALRLAEALKDRAREEAAAALAKVRDGAGDAATKRKAAELLESITRKPR